MNTTVVMRSVMHRFIVFGSLVLVLLVIYNCLNLTFIKNNGNDIGSIVELVRKNNSNNPITYEYFQNHEVSGLENITAYSELIGSISNKFGVFENDIKLTLIDEKYNSIYKKDMLAGTFPNSHAVEVGQEYVVISDALSIKLFKSTDAIGNEVNILNKKYKVLGIYKSNKSMLWSLFGDGFDRVFIPYMSGENGIGQPVDVLTIRINQDQNMYDVDNKLKEEFNEKLNTYSTIDYTTIYPALNQYNSMIIFVLGIIAIIKTLLFMVRYLISFFRKIKSQGNEYYLSENLRVELKKIVLSFVIILICCSAIIYLISLIKFKLYTPERYIPNDNIFDLKFYSDQLLSDIRAKNIISDTPYSYLQYVYQKVLNFNIIFNTVIIFFMIAVVSYFKLLKIGEVKFRSILKCILLVIAVGCLVGLVLCLALGLEIKVPIKGLIIIAYFYFISSLSGASKQFV